MEKKIALITGANKGIGLETARQMAGLGYQVLLGARKAAEGRAAAESIGVQFVHLDMSDPATFRAAADKIAAEYGRLDVLVNNAGIGPDNGLKPSESPMAITTRPASLFLSSGSNTCVSSTTAKTLVSKVSRIKFVEHFG